LGLSKQVRKEIDYSVSTTKDEREKWVWSEEMVPTRRSAADCSTAGQTKHGWKRVEFNASPYALLVISEAVKQMPTTEHKNDKFPAHLDLADKHKEQKCFCTV